MPVLVGDCHLLYALFDIFVRSFDNTIHFRPIGRGIVMLNLELFAQSGEHGIVQVYTVVRDNPVGDTIPANEVLLDEAGNHILCDGCEGRCFDPLVK